MRIPHVVVPVLLASALVAQKASWPYSMDYGPWLMTTVEHGGLAKTTDKAFVIKLGDRGAVSFDTELLRVSSAWTDGWLRLRGVAYDGAHGPMSARRGTAVFETKPAPGWASNGSFADPRSIPHGPLPKSWGKYGGHSRVGDHTVIDYTVGSMRVREMFEFDDNGLLLRTMELGPSNELHRMTVCDGPAGAEKGSATVGGKKSVAMLVWSDAKERVQMRGTSGDWDKLSIGAPANDDYIEKGSGTGATVTFVPGFAKVHRGEAALFRLHDGVAAANDDDTTNSVWFDKHKVKNRQTDRGRFHVDLQKNVQVDRVHTYSWHKAERARQQYVLYGSDAADADVGAKDLRAAGWKVIARVDTESLGYGDKQAVAISEAAGLGTFRHLVFDLQRGGTFFSEIDVYAGKHQKKLRPGHSTHCLAAAVHGSEGPSVAADNERIVMTVPPHDKTLRVCVAIGNFSGELKMNEIAAERTVDGIPLGPGNARYPNVITTKGVIGADDGPFAVDTITIPFDNPHGSRMRTGAFDFFSDGRAAVSTWNGDVWVVSGIDEDLDKLEWRRFATGLYDPLGLRIVNDVVHVHGRDGLTRLIDTDGDGEADRYECFNNQVYITPAFHEFAFDLQTDKDGNFYFSKGAPVNPGGRGFQKIVPHHGTILKVSPDGSTIETVATGLRAPNGVGVSPTGVLTSGDNEGTYMPRCRLNWIEKKGFYAGVKDTAHRTPVPDQPDLPLCWMPMEVDNSSGGQVWVTGAAWRDLQGRLLHNSYGTCSTYLVLPERVNGQMQGGVVRLPVDYSSSAMRGRFSPIDGQLYTVGLKGWQTSASREGGFHRVRRTGKPLDLPTKLRTCKKGVYLTFSDALDAETAADPEAYSVEIWNYRYSQNYGSPEISVLDPKREKPQGKQNRDALKVTSAQLLKDGRTVFLAIEGMQPVHQMKITWDMDTADGRLLRGELHNSIHALNDEVKDD